MEGRLLKNPLILLVEGILFKARRVRTGLEGALLGDVTVGGEGGRDSSGLGDGEMRLFGVRSGRLGDGDNSESVGTAVCPSNSDSKSAT